MDRHRHEAQHRGECGKCVDQRSAQTTVGELSAPQVAVGQCGEHLCRHQQSMTRRRRAGDIAQSEDRHEGHEHCLAQQSAGDPRQHRRADKDTQPLAGGELPGNGDGNLLQQAHDDELSHPDPEGAGCQGIS